MKWGVKQEDKTIQDKIIDSVYAQQNNLIVGRAGAGKSTLYESMADTLTDSCVRVGSTGVSAINVGGQTAHRLFRIPVGIPTQKDFENKATIRNLRKIFNKDSPVGFVFIDETSMINAASLTWIDFVLKQCYNNDLPFGGLGMNLFGDLFQLGCVVRPEERPLYLEHFNAINFFEADAFKKANFNLFNMTEVHRQSDQELKKHLNNIRVYGQLFSLKESLEYFNDNCFNKTQQNDCEDYLVTTNKNAEYRNKIAFDKIKSKAFHFKAKFSGFDSEPAPKDLYLKQGCRVMILENNLEQGYSNGTKGTVKSLNKFDVTVMLDSGKEVCIGPKTWVQYSYKLDKENQLVKFESGSYTQIPLKMSNGLTIHKSQGCDLDRANIDLGDFCFAPHLAYVALSRVRTIEGIHLVRPLKQADIKIDYSVNRFCKSNNLL